MMCDVLKSSKRGIRFPFKTRTPLLSLLQILAFEANNILIMKQIKQLPLCYPLSGFTTLIISNSLWCWCLPKKPLTRPPLTHHDWSEKARTLSKTFFLWSAPSALTWPGAQLSPLPFVVTGQQLSVRTQGHRAHFLLPALFALHSLTLISNELSSGYWENWMFSGSQQPPLSWSPLRVVNRCRFLLASRLLTVCPKIRLSVSRRNSGTSMNC